MEHLREVLLDVWREACRHTEIGESTETIAAILRRQMPLAHVLVRQVDRQRGCVETLAVGPAGNGTGLSEARTECPAAEIDALLAWCRRGEVARLEDRDTCGPGLRHVVPAGPACDALAGPLPMPDDQFGLLVLLAEPGSRFSPRDAELARVLLDPLAAALRNDHQLREMAALREAAEAERQSLLTRLGRKKLADTVIGAGSGLRAVMERVELVARSDVPALILGETGSGKELIARTIHTRSPRHEGPFIRVNCGAIPPELIDSQLFGHQQGAFTGAVETRKGWFERADAGTLLLDEIGELPPAAQVRLLRILQDGWLERVGGHHPINVDVRIVAATHRDLAAMVAEGRFREDLWYRIAVFPIFLPPLRERKEDIAELAGHFAERAAVRFGLPRAMPGPEDVALLRAYAWPGNVRELATVIDRAAILGNGRRLEVATALGTGAGVVPAPSEQQAASDSLTPAAAVPILPLDEAMRRHIEDALRATHGRIEGPFGAAAVLKINPHTLRARMRKLGVDWARFRETGAP
jgi:hydrogenase-4 transcriptional activator